ncbi:MAG: DUF262 domain-containing protein, partial [Candidatus Zixiibacteriota bacterium]
KCVYSGKLMKMLEELNTDSNWRLLIGRKNPDKRLRDVEWILRIISFYEYEDKYEKPMKEFLNQYLKKARKLQDEKLSDKIEKTRNIFLNTCEYILDQLGEKPFQVKGRFNYAVLDSVFCTCIKAMESCKKDIKNRFERLKEDDEFLQNVTANTSDQIAVSKRFEKARKYLLSV